MKSHKCTRLFLIIFLCGLFFSKGILAALLSQSSVFGVDTITLDTQTDFQWLDLSVTEGRSFSNVSSQFVSTGQFAGYRYATVNEVNELFQHASIPQIGAPGIFSIEQFKAVDQFMGLVGGRLRNTDPAGVCPSCYGWYSLGLTSSISATSASISPPGTYLGYSYSYLGVTDDPVHGIIFGYANPSHGALVDFMGVPVGMGSWLVRSVPAPATFWLFAFGLFVILFLKEPNHACA